jgi:hypothetical protein
LIGVIVVDDNNGESVTTNLGIVSIGRFIICVGKVVITFSESRTINGTSATNSFDKDTIN